MFEKLKNMKENHIVSLKKIHDVYLALDKHFALENYNLFYTVLTYKNRRAYRVFICWRVNRRLYDKIFSLRSAPIFSFPSWLKLAFVYEYDKRLRSCGDKKNEKDSTI